MIKINLLPVELRRVEVVRTKFPFRSMFITLFFIILIGSLYQFFLYLHVKSKLNHLNSEVTHIFEPGREADQLNQAINLKLLPEKHFLDQYVLPNFLVAEAMNDLSDLLPESIWFGDLTIKRDQGSLSLELMGFTRMTSKLIAVAQIQEYVNSVKAKLEELFQKEASRSDALPQEVKVVLTTNLQQVASLETMQFFAVFKSKPVAKGK